MQVSAKIDADHVNNPMKKNAVGANVLFTDKNMAYVALGSL
jgi:hypothetical protein